jgi:hypothetical protein
MATCLTVSYHLTLTRSLLRPPCVSSVVQLARVLARCVLAAAVVSVASAESKDGDPKKVCVLADAAGGPRAARRACPRVYAI